LENAKELMTEFEEKLNTEVRKQKKLNMTDEKNFRREKLQKKYTVKMLYKWNNSVTTLS